MVDFAGRSSMHWIGAHLCVAGLALALFQDMDPSGNAFGMSDTPLTRYASYLLIVGGAAASLFNAIPLRLFSIPAFWLLTFLFIFMGAGSLVQLAPGAPVHASYLGRSLGMLVAISGIIFGLKAQPNRALLYRIAWFGAIAGIAALFIRTFHVLFPNFLHVSQSYHVEYFILLAGSYFIFLVKSPALLRVAVLVAILTTGLLSGKVTSYVLLLVFITLVFGRKILASLSAAKRRQEHATIGLMLTFAAGSTIAGGSLGFYELIQRMGAREAERTNDLRDIMYAMRIDQFKDSPFVGDLFTSSPLIEFNPLTNLLLPSHNDHLDILAAGGALGFGLWISVLLIALFRKSTLHALAFPAQSRPEVVYLVALFVLGTIVSTVNPILPNPRIAALWLFALGYLCTLRVNQTPPESGGRSPI